jgi:hypothetical protein
MRRCYLLSWSRNFEPFMFPKIHCCAQNSPPLDRILKQLNPIHHLISYFFNVNINIILPFMPRSPRLSLSVRFLNSNFLCSCNLPPYIHTPFPSRPPLCDHPINIWSRVEIVRFLILEFRPPSCHFPSQCFGFQIFSTLTCSQTRSLITILIAHVRLR